MIESTALAPPTAAISVEHSEKIFELLVPLLAHSCLRSSESYKLEVARTRTQTSLLHLAGNELWAPTKSISSFMTCARKVVGNSLKFRTGQVYINGNNIFNTQFTPPLASRTQDALRLILYKGFENWKKAETIHDKAFSAIKIYFLLITIHPFNDMNGRTARFYFSAHARLLGELSPTILLSFIAMHRNNSDYFIQACKIGRQGDMTAIAHEFNHSMKHAQKYLCSYIQEVSSLISNSANTEEIDEVLLNLRSCIQDFVLCDSH